MPSRRIDKVGVPVTTLNEPLAHETLSAERALVSGLPEPLGTRHSEAATPAPRAGTRHEEAAAPRARTKFEEAAIAAGRAAVVLVPVLLVLQTSGRSDVGLLEAVAVAAIWLVGFRSSLGAVWLPYRAVGVPTASVLGTLTGLACVTLVEFWVLGAGLSSQELLVMTIGILVTSVAFETLLARALPQRRTVLVVGASGGGAELTGELIRRRELPFRCLGIVCDEDDIEHLPNALVLGASADLAEIVRVTQPDIVVLGGADDRSASAELIDSISIRFQLVEIPEFYEQAFARVPIEHLSPTWFTSVHRYQSWHGRAAKRLLDVLLACAGLLVTALLFPIIATAVYFSGPGPVFFGQRRLGEGGGTFQMWKFRTMTDGAECPGRPQWAEKNDLRITPVGRVLRRTRLDELPQLWNVLRGDMSVVGPRPERPEFLKLLQAEVPYWTQRHLTKPGITGWAQVRRGYTSDVGGTADKLSYDLYYLKHRSIVLDLAIMVRTVQTLVSGYGAQ